MSHTRHLLLRRYQEAHATMGSDGIDTTSSTFDRTITYDHVRSRTITKSIQQKAGSVRSLKPQPAEKGAYTYEAGTLVARILAKETSKDHVRTL